MIRLVLLSLLICIPLQAQPVVHYSNSNGSLDKGWEWAKREGGNQSFWIAYRVDKLMSPRSFYGSFGRANIEKERSLYALVGEPEKYDETLNEVHPGWNFNGRGVIHITGDKKDTVNKLILKEIAILVKYESGTPIQVVASNMSLQHDLEDAPLYWLDHAEDGESIGALLNIYRQLVHNDSREDLISVLGMHGQHVEVERFALRVLNSTADPDVRERAAYVMGQQDTETALKVLGDVIQNDDSENVQEHAVYAITQMTLPEAQDYLIDLSITARNKDVRKKAIYGLGQKATQKALSALNETIYDEADAEVQKHAVYALAQFDSERAVPRLIEIANSHPSPKVRKSAIYMLGDIGNDQAVEALIEIVEQQ